MPCKVRLKLTGILGFSDTPCASGFSKPHRHRAVSTVVKMLKPADTRHKISGV